MSLRGGNWNNGANAGVFALNLNNLRSNVNTNIGFRPALLQRQISDSQDCLVSARRKGGPAPSRKGKYKQIQTAGNCL